MPRHPTSHGGAARGRSGSSGSHARTYHGERGRYEEGIHDYYHHDHSYHSPNDLQHGPLNRPIVIPFHEQQSRPSSHGDDHSHIHDEMHGIRLETSSERGRGSNSVPEVHSHQSHRPYIVVDENGEMVVNVGREIVNILKSMFRGAWITWREVDTNNREILWERFRQMYRWADGDDVVVHQAWEKVLARRFTDMLGETRGLAQKRAKAQNVEGLPNNFTHLIPFSPPWIRQEYWSRMIETWNTPEWQAKSKKGKQNRSSKVDGCIVKHSGGSISYGQYRKRMTKELGHEVSIDEVFLRTHTSKASREAEASGTGTAQFIHPRAERVFNEYTSRVVEDYGSETSSHPIGDYRLWNKVTGGRKKGRVYGCGASRDPEFVVTGTTSIHSTGRSSFHGASSSSKEVQILKQTVEILQQKLEETNRRENRRIMDEKFAELARMIQQNPRDLPTN